MENVRDVMIEKNWCIIDLYEDIWQQRLRGNALRSQRIHEEEIISSKHRSVIYWTIAKVELYSL